MEHEHFKNIGDALALLGAVSSLFIDAVPWLAAFVSLVWTLIRMYEWAKHEKGWF